MKIKNLIILATLLIGITAPSFAQFSIRPSARLLYATRGGFFIGVNQSFHSGDIPTNPYYSELGFIGNQAGVMPSTIGSGQQGTNFIFGAHIDKAVSGNVSLGLRLIFDQMNVDVSGDPQMQPFRITDDNGVPYDVELDNTMDFTLRYLTVAGVVKIYFYRTYGFYFLAGASVGTLLTGDYRYQPRVVMPTWARGSEGDAQTDEIPDVNTFRFSLIPGIGYDFYYRGVFITPEISGDIGLTNVLNDAVNDGDPWKVINLQGSLRLSFIIL